MNNKKIVIVLAVVSAFVISGYGLYQFGLRQGTQAAAKATGNAATTKSDGNNRKILYWHDPMAPGQKFDKPGKSPFMDMQLVPVYADGADGADSADGTGGSKSADQGSVNISPRVQQNLGIRIAEVSKANLTSPVSTVGTVAYNERDVALVQARSNGFVEKLYVRAPLDIVRKGQPLAELYVPDWVAAQEEYLTARRMQATGIADLQEAAQQRMRLVGMNDEQIRQVTSSGKVHPRITITAPVSGVVSELAVREGMTVATGAPLFRINGLATIWVNAEIPENLTAQVGPGNSVEARTPSLPGVSFQGKVSAILPQVDTTTRTLKARIELANPNGTLVPGMFATLNFHSGLHKDVLLVPTEAVIATGTRHVVMLAQGDGKFIPVDVETGAEASGQTEIRKGLEAGQKVVVSGQFLIDSEASLKGTATRMGATPAENATDMSKANNKIHHGSGKVEKIDNNEITLSHGPIASLGWDAMTMAFKLPASGLPRNVKAGDTVIFDLRQVQDGGYQIVSVSPAAGAQK